jgi:hypothetical protein
MTVLLHVPRNRLVTLVRAAVTLVVLAGVFATSAVAAGSPPQTSSPPTVEGQPVVGKTLSAGNGLWANSPTDMEVGLSTVASGGAGWVGRVGRWRWRDAPGAARAEGPVWSTAGQTDIGYEMGAVRFG